MLKKLDSYIISINTVVNVSGSVNFDIELAWDTSPHILIVFSQLSRLLGTLDHKRLHDKGPSDT
jgi:hypothetical protein